MTDHLDEFAARGPSPTAPLEATCNIGVTSFVRDDETFYSPAAG